MNTYSYSIPLFGISGPLSSTGFVIIQILDANGNQVSATNSVFTVESYIARTINLTGVGDLAAGTYTIIAKLARISVGEGDTKNLVASFNLCSEFVGVYPGQLIISIFPK